MFQFSKFQLLKAARALALAAVVSVGFSGALIAAEHGEGNPLTRDELLTAALAGDPTARTALQAMFGELVGDSEAITALAVELIVSLGGDPVANADASFLISDVASDILSTQAIVRVSVDNDFSLPRGALGWDLGSPDSPTFAGFTKLTERDKGIVYGSTGGIQRPGGEGLLSDGLIGVTKIFLDVDVPDGAYRLILMTDDQGNQSFVNPLGRSIMVNGVRTFMNDSVPENWASNGLLGSLSNRFGSGGAGGTGTGGATVIYLEVVNGKLEIEFEEARNSNILLTGFILEPDDGPSVLTTPEEIFTDEDEILVAEGRIADAIGQSLETTASAAGDESQREDILNLQDPVAEITEAVSPS